VDEFHLYSEQVENWKQVIEKGILKLIGLKVSCKIENNLATATFRINLVDSRQILSSFSLTQLPGCCGVMVSFHSYVSVDHRGKGIGSFLHGVKVGVAKESGYSSILCTDVEGNLPQEAILNKNGWEKIATFNNARTLNDVAIHFKDLR